MIQAIRWCAMLAYVAKFSFKEYQILPNFFSSQKKKIFYQNFFFMSRTMTKCVLCILRSLARRQ